MNKINLRQYILSLVLTSLICGIVTSFPASGPAKELIRLLCSMLLILTLFMPMKYIDITTQHHQFLNLSKLGKVEAQYGEEMAHNAKIILIKEQLESYILNQANELNAEISVDVSVDQTLLPQSVTITGATTPESRQRLEKILSEDLGITKEHQIWDG